MGLASSEMHTLQVCSPLLKFNPVTNLRTSIRPHDYAMDLQAMTKEKLQFSLPVVFTVGPDLNQRGANQRGGVDDEAEDISAREDRGDALMKYAMLLADAEAKEHVHQSQHVANIVKGIIEG